MVIKLDQENGKIEEETKTRTKTFFFLFSLLLPRIGLMGKCYFLFFIFLSPRSQHSRLNLRIYLGAKTIKQIIYFSGLGYNREKRFSSPFLVGLLFPADPFQVRIRGPSTSISKLLDHTITVLAS